MIFNVDRTFLVRTHEKINLNPEDFLQCATIEELYNEVEDFINDKCEYPIHPNLDKSEELGNRYWDITFEFYDKWQQLKGLPQNL